MFAAEFHNPGDVFNTLESRPGEPPPKPAKPPSAGLVSRTTLKEFLHFLAQSRLFSEEELDELRPEAARFDLNQDASRSPIT